MGWKLAFITVISAVAAFAAVVLVFDYLGAEFFSALGSFLPHL